jgi:arabinogalactan oligomer / maltooligosaccharide transport system substrate-binding protein
MTGLSRRTILAAAGASALSACAPGRAGPASLVVWHAYRGREGEALQKVTHAYNRAHSGVVAPVRLIAVPFDAFADKISAAIPRSKGPDIFIFAHERLGGWVEGGRTVEPIGFWMDDKLRASFLPGLLNALTYKDEVFGVPLNFKSSALIYNKTLVPEPPATTTALEDIAARLTQAGRGAYGLAYPYDDFFYHAALQNGFGGGVFDAAGAPTMNHPGNIRAAELLLRWRREKPTMPDEPSFSLVQGLFNQGRTAMTISGPWFLGEVNPAIPYGVAPLPRIDAPEGGPLRPYLTVEAGFVAASSARKEEAFAFLAYLAGSEAGLVLAREGGQLHASAAIYETQAMRGDPIAMAFKAQQENALPMPNIPEMTLIWSPADKAMKRMVKGEASPAAAWNEAQTEVIASITALRGARG